MKTAIQPKAALWAGLLIGCGPDLGPVVTEISSALHETAHISAPEVIDPDLNRVPAEWQDSWWRDPQMTSAQCDKVQVSLAQACGRIVDKGVAPDCSSQATFVSTDDDHGLCASRVQLPAADAGELVAVYGFDLVGKTPSCGNGVLDPGEACDDAVATVGGRCQGCRLVNQFNGCEAMIEEHFQRAGIAYVPRYTWSPKVAHVIVNSGVSPAEPVSAGLCAQAKAAADGVCSQLTRDMPFVGACRAATRLGTDPAGDYCAVRFNVSFSKVDRPAGVYTTRLPGILSFTLR